MAAEDDKFVVALILLPALTIRYERPADLRAMTMNEHPVGVYLAAAGETADAFARRAQVSPRFLADMLSRRVTPDLSAARRIVAATGGGVTIEDLLSADGARVDDLAPRARRLNESLLSAAIEVVAPECFGQNSPEAAAISAFASDAYAALAGFTARRIDRLVEALVPPLEERFRGLLLRRDPAAAARHMARLYFAAEARLVSAH